MLDASTSNLFRYSVGNDSLTTPDFRPLRANSLPARRVRLGSCSLSLLGRWQQVQSACEHVEVKRVPAVFRSSLCPRRSTLRGQSQGQDEANGQPTSHWEC